MDFKILSASSLIAIAVSASFYSSAIAADEQPVKPSPVPPAAAPGIGLEEIKPTLQVDVIAGKSKLFRTKSKIVRVSVSDPAIAEPVVISEREFMLIGKGPGSVSLFLWCDGDKEPRKVM